MGFVKCKFGLWNVLLVLFKWSVNYENDYFYDREWKMNHSGPNVWAYSVVEIYFETVNFVITCDILLVQLSFNTYVLLKFKCLWEDQKHSPLEIFYLFTQFSYLCTNLKSNFGLQSLPKIPYHQFYCASFLICSSKFQLAWEYPFLRGSYLGKQASKLYLSALQSFVTVSLCMVYD